MDVHSSDARVNPNSRVPRPAESATMAGMTTPSKHRLRWYQYSLRSMFVLTVLVAIAGSWFAVKRQQKERERAAVKWIRDSWGSVNYAWELDAGLRPIPTAGPPGPAWLRAWLGDDFFAHVVSVGLATSRVT